MIRFVSVVVFAASASAALAECPTSFEDAADGVYLEFGDRIVRLDRQADGTVEEIETILSTGEFTRYISHLGLFVLERSGMVNGVLQPDTFETISYDAAPPTRLEPGLVYATDTVVTEAGSDPFPEPIALTVGDGGNLAVGGCQVSILPVEIRFGAVQDQYSDHFLYFPDLGLGSYIGGGPTGETPTLETLLYIGTEPRTGDAMPIQDAPPKK